MENEKTINTNMLIELPELIKAKFLEDAEGAFKAVSEKVLKNKGEISLVTQSQFIQGFEEREFELLEQINQLKKQIK